jgi:hypothetical protein
MLAGVVCVAAALRLWGIGREALWFDEAMSARFAAMAPATMLRTTACDSSPPLYYAVLRAWSGVFGADDAALRACSTAWSLLGIVLLSGFAWRLGGARAALAAAALSSVNPLDVFFAQEARMYAQAGAMATASTWVLWEWLRARSAPARALLWLAYACLAAAMLFTHYATLAVLLAQGAWAIAILLRERRMRALAAYLAAGIASAVGLAPWFIFVGMACGRLNTSAIAWMKPPPTSHYANYLWRDFLWGHASAMQDRWWYAGALLIVAVLAAIALCAVRVARAPGSAAARPVGLAYCAWLAFTPPLFAGILSLATVPMYNRERFALYVLPPFLALASLCLTASALRRAGMALLALLLLVTGTGTLIQARTPLRTDWRAFERLWREAGPPARVVFFPGYEALPASRVLGLRVPGARPDELEMDAASLKGSAIWTVVTDPGLAHASAAEQGYAAWIGGLGGHRALLVRPGIEVHAVTVGEFRLPEEFRGRFRAWYEPDDIKGRIEGFKDPARFHSLEGAAEGKPFRWTKPTAWVVLKQVDGATTATIRFRGAPGAKGDVRFTAVRLEDTAKQHMAMVNVPASPDEAEADISIPAGSGPVALGWEVPPFNPAQDGSSPDARDLGIQVRWIGIAGR